MKQLTEWSQRLAADVGQRVAHFRHHAAGDGRGGRMSAQALADRCTELGHPLDRTVIVKLEKGSRQTVTLADVLVLARALDVTPLELVFPVGRSAAIEALPGLTVDPWAAAKWFTGEPPASNEEPLADWRPPFPSAIALCREHDRLVSNHGNETGWIALRRRMADDPAAVTQREHLLELAATAERGVHEIENGLRTHRQWMREYGCQPPELPVQLRHVDMEGSDTDV